MKTIGSLLQQIESKCNANVFCREKSKFLDSALTLALALALVGFTVFTHCVRSWQNARRITSMCITMGYRECIKTKPYGL